MSSVSYSDDYSEYSLQSSYNTYSYNYADLYDDPDTACLAPDVKNSPSPSSPSSSSCSSSSSRLYSSPYTSLPLHDDWNNEYQRLLDSLPASQAELTQFVQDFCVVATDIARRIVLGEISPTDAGGFAGGLKFISHGIFFKKVSDEHGLYGSEEGAAKAAAHELHGVRAYLDASLANPDLKLRTPLMTIVDYAGVRIVALCVLPITKSTLAYGSADAGRTVHRNAEIASLMEQAGSHINLEPHLVGPAQQPEELVAPCDIEVHAIPGPDPQFYVLDTARVFPPQMPDSTARILVIPHQSDFDLIPLDLHPEQDQSLTSFLSTLLNSSPLPQDQSWWTFIHATLMRTYTKYMNPDELRCVYHSEMIQSLDERVNHTDHSAALTAIPINSSGSSATFLVSVSDGPINKRASQLLNGQNVHGNAAIIMHRKGGHLYTMLRPELVKSNPTPLSSDAFTGFGRINAEQHNAPVRTATHRLIHQVIPAFAEELNSSRVLVGNGRALCDAMHRNGINMRYLGILRLHVSNVTNRLPSLLLTEMVVRCCKVELRRRMRDTTDLDQAQVIVAFFNLLFGSTSSSQVYWQLTLPQVLLHKFGVIYTPSELAQAAMSSTARRHIHAQLRSFVDFAELFRELQLRCGCWMTMEHQKSFPVNPAAYTSRDKPFVVDDVALLLPLSQPVSWQPFLPLSVSDSKTDIASAQHTLSSIAAAVTHDDLPSVELFDQAWQVLSPVLLACDARIACLYARAQLLMLHGRHTEAVDQWQLVAEETQLVYGQASQHVYTGTVHVSSHGYQHANSIEIQRGHPFLLVIANHVVELCAMVGKGVPPMAGTDLASLARLAPPEHPTCRKFTHSLFTFVSDKQPEEFDLKQVIASHSRIPESEIEIDNAAQAWYNEVCKFDNLAELWAYATFVPTRLHASAPMPTPSPPDNSQNDSKGDISGVLLECLAYTDGYFSNPWQNCPVGKYVTSKRSVIRQSGPDSSTTVTLTRDVLYENSEQGATVIQVHLDEATGAVQSHGLRVIKPNAALASMGASRDWKLLDESESTQASSVSLEWNGTTVPVPTQTYVAEWQVESAATKSTSEYHTTCQVPSGADPNSIIALYSETNTTMKMRGYEMKMTSSSRVLEIAYTHESDGQGWNNCYRRETLSQSAGRPQPNKTTSVCTVHQPVSTLLTESVQVSGATTTTQLNQVVDIGTLLSDKLIELVAMTDLPAL
jgi:Clustered mitochondria/Translation initiation factor eIF3 subunit 135